MSNENIYKLITEFDLSKPMKVEIQYEEIDDKDFSSDNVDAETAPCQLLLNHHSSINGRDNSSSISDKRDKRNKQPVQHFDANIPFRNNIHVGPAKSLSTNQNANGLDTLIKKMSATLIKVIIMSRSSVKFTKIKYNLYGKTLNTIQLLLRQEDISDSVNKIIGRTLDFTINLGIICTRTEVEMLLLDMIEWAKFQKSQTIAENTVNVDSNYNHSSPSTTNDNNNPKNIVCIYKHGPPESEVTLSIDSTMLQAALPEPVAKYLDSNYNFNTDSSASTNNDNRNAVKRPATTNTRRTAKRGSRQNIPHPDRLDKRHPASYAPYPNVPQITPRPKLPMHNQAPPWFDSNYNDSHLPPRAQMPQLSAFNEGTSWQTPQIRDPSHFQCGAAPSYSEAHFQFGYNSHRVTGSYTIPVGSSPPILPQRQSPPYQEARLPPDQFTLSNSFRMDSQRANILTPYVDNFQSKETAMPNNALLSRNTGNTNQNDPQCQHSGINANNNSELLAHLTSLNKPSYSTVNGVCNICGEHAKSKCAYRHLLQ